MKHVKRFTQYIKESITSNIDDLLNSINDKKVDFYDLNLSSDIYADMSIDDFYNNDEFNKQLFKDNLKKGDLEYTENFENFLKKDLELKFFFLFNRKDSLINNPEFLIMEYSKDNNWKPIEIYKIQGSVEDFYNKLSAKVIKLTKDKTTYIYSTSNSGNNWILKDEDKKNSDFKSSMDKEEIKSLIKNGTELDIID